MRRRLLFLIIVANAVLPGIGCRYSSNSHEEYNFKAIRGTVTGCWDDRKELDVLTDTGRLVHLNVNGPMPLCGSFAKGGTWSIHYRPVVLAGGAVAIDWIQKVGQ